MIQNNDANVPMTNREIGLQALCDALGPSGMVDFIMEGKEGSGDYTKEKYDLPDPTIEEIKAFLEEQKKANG